jgi:hypothetical protein
MHPTSPQQAYLQRPKRISQGLNKVRVLGDQPATETKPNRPLRAPERQRRAEKPKAPTLPPEPSTDLRHQLISELEQLSEPEALATWAHRALPLKNRLAPADAQSVESAFAAKLSRLSDATPEPPEIRNANGDAQQHREAKSSAGEVLTISKPVRERDRNHLRFVASQPCLVCGRTPSDAHHLKFAEQRAMGRKVSDKFTVPVCRLHHRELHRRGDERAWWQMQRIDPLPIAASLWESTHAIESAVADQADRSIG